MTHELETLYRKYCDSGTAIAAHLPRLRALATGLGTVAEFGVKRGASTTALLLGADRVFSVDIKATDEARALQALAGDRWTYRIGDSRKVEIPDCDLLFLDSQHDYAQVAAELDAHAHKVKRYLVFHDVTTFGEVAAVGETGKQAWTYTTGQSVPPQHYGVRPAIDAFQIAHPEWRIAARYVDSHGLLVLERTQPINVEVLLDGKAIARQLLASLEKRERPDLPR